MKVIALCGPAVGCVLLGVVGGHDGAGQGWADAVAAHADLGGFGDGLACGAFVDDVGLWEALRPVQLTRGEHAQAYVGNLVRLAAHGDQAEAVFGGDGVQWLAHGRVLVGAVIGIQECNYLLRTARNAVVCDTCKRLAI